jgi:rod shape-determining protein MreD
MILFFVALQGTVFSAMDFLGTVPALCLMVVVFIAMIRGSAEGAIMGAAMGLVCDIVSSGRVGGNALLFMWIGLGAGYICRTYFQVSKQVALIFAVISIAVYSLLYYIFGFLVMGEFNAIYAFWRIILPGLSYSAVLAVPLYALLEKVNIWIS